MISMEIFLYIISFFAGVYLADRILPNNKSLAEKIMEERNKE